MRRRSSSDKTRLRRSRPSITLSFASSRSRMSTTALLRRAASSAASFTMFASSAPAGLARDRLGEQRLPRSRRADEQGALWQPPAQPLELLGILQEVDDLLELLLGLVRAGDVGERHLGRVAREQLRLGLAERKRAVPALLHLTQHENEQAEDQQVRQEAEEEHAERLLLLAGAHVYALVAQRGDPRVVRLERQERREVVVVAAADGHGGLEAALHLLPLGDLDGVDVGFVELLGELRVGDLHRLLSPVRRELNERDRAHDQQRPKRERAERPGPAELARRRDAVGHQVKLATYGRCRKFSA